MKKYIYIPSIYPKIRRLFYLTSLLLGTVLCAKAQVTISLDYKEKNDLTTVQSGDKYTLQLNYSVSSTTGNASNVKAVINLPDNIYTVGEFVGTTHAPVANFVFTNTVGAKKLTITFINPVPSGSTGVLEFIVRTNNLTTPNNTQLCTTAEITDGSGATSGAKNHCINVTAVPRICALKTLLNGGAINNITTYRIRVSANGGSNPLVTPFGTLQATNITVTDNLPANAEFISAKVFHINGTQVGTGTYSAGVVTATIPNLTLRQYGNGTWESFYFNLDIQVKFNSPTFNASDVVTNTATVDYTPFSGSAAVLNNGDNVGGNCVSDLIETTTLANPVTAAVLTKGGSGNYFPGQRFSYGWSFTNTGNVPLENVEIIETIPANAIIDQDAEYNGVRVLDWEDIHHIEYQTNVSGSTWVALGAGVGVPDLPSGTYFTKIKFVLTSPFMPNASILSSSQILHFKAIGEVTVAETVTNCMEWTSTTAGIPNQAGRTVCNSSVTLQPRPTTSRAIYSVAHSSDCVQVAGGTVTFSGTLVADIGYSNGLNPVCALLIPSGSIYVPGSVIFANNTGITPPTLEIIPNYITTGGVLRDLYRWTFPSGTVVPYGERFTVRVSVKISPALPPGPYNADFIATFSNASANAPDYNFGNFTDTKDWDLDGNTTELVGRSNTNHGQCEINIAASASMESIKWVKGLCDVAYSRYPAFGQTVPGGDADYRLIIKNTGNVVMKDIKIIDILPFVGDRGVIDPQPRQSQWRPNLANPISAPAGVTVYYTTVSNPCRDEVKQPSDPSPFPTGCTPPNWSVTPPLDITQVQAVKIDFGTKTLIGGDSLVFSWPMRAPVDAPTNDEIAWNSFGFVATRTDNNQPLLAAEPIKVGIKLKPIQPAVYGDYVWIDTNKNGIQDDGATGVSGVRVELYKDNGDGISDPTTDLFVGFTVTDGAGKYLFSTLQPGDYFAKFYPPAGYVTTTSNQGGNDALDSDGIITIVTTLDAGEDDRTWDLGIYQDTNCDVKITNYTLSPCVWTGTASEVTANVFVAWANAPSGQNINVTLNGVTKTIDLTTATSPALVSFTLPANNTDYVLNAVFSGTSTCKDSKTIRTPLPCQPAVCVLNIDAVNVGACKDDKAPLDIVVSWSGNPSGENIVVTAGDSTRIINVAGGVLSPVTVNFNMPSNGQVDVPINVGFQTTTACKDTDKFTLPNCVCIKPNAGNDVSVCAPVTTAKLTAITTGGTWAPIGSPANPAAATIDANGNVTGMTVAGTYRFVYSVSGPNCTDTAQVVVNAKPTIADGSASICAGESVNLTTRITNYATYLSPVWTVGTAGGTAVTTPTSVKPTGTTTYVLVAQNAAGCKDTANVVVTVNAKPNAGKDTTLACVNAATNTLATSYTLVPSPAGGTWAQLGTTPTTATISGNNVTGMTVTGTYQFIYTTTAGCKDTVAVTVAPCAGCVKPNAGADAANVCQPTSTAKLTAVTTGGTWAPIGSPANPSAATIDVSGNISGLNAAGTYKFVYSVTSGGQTCTDTAQVIVLAKPVIADGSATICAGESVDLTTKITNYASYLSPVWTVGTAGGTAVATPSAVKPTGTTTYVLVAQNAAGCKDTANVVVTVNAKPNAGKDTTLVCVNAATNTLATSITLSPSPAGGTWSQIGTTPASATITGNNVTGMSVAGTYQFIYTTTAGCKDTVAITVAPCAGCVKPNAGPDAASVCQPTSTAKLTAVTAGGTWAPIGSPANPSAATIDASGNISGLNAAGTYKFVYSITSGGQTCTDTAQVIVLAKPVIADGSATICAGESVDLASKITNYNTYLSPVWTVGTASGTAVATPSSVKPTGTTTYVLVAQNAAGCKDTANVVVTVNAKPNAGKDTTLVCVNAATNTLATSITLSPSPAGGTWSQIGTTPASATITGNNVTGMTVAGTYQFSYTTAAGCKDTIVVTVAPCAGCVKPNAGADAASVCQPTSTAKLTAVTAGGTWAPIVSPANPSAATIDASGNISGLNAAGTYKFVYSITSGGQTCTDTAQVIVLAKPVIADGSATICAGESVDLTSKITNYNTYLSPVWTVGTAGGTAVATPSSVKPTGTTTYVLVAQNAAGCKDTANVVVTVNPKPSAGKDTTLVCSNGNVPASVQLSATPTGGTWSALTGNPTGATVNSAGLVSITNATAQGKSFDFVYLVNGCQDTVKVIVPVCQQPCIKSSISSAAPVCSNDAQTYSFTFTINNQLGIVKVSKGTLSGTNPYTVSGIPSGQNVIITDSLSAVCKSDTIIAGVNCNCNPAMPQLLTPSLTACIGDTFPTLKATVVGLATVEWFSQQTGGTVLSTGLNYKPSGTVTANTVFYAQARSTDPTCPTAVSTSRVPATINAQSCIDTIDLALKKSINTKIARVGDVLTYTIKVWNEWTKNATGVEVVDSVATTVQFVSGSFVASRGSATISGNVIKWNIGNIAAGGDTVTLRYQVKATQAGIHLNTAEISKTNEKDRDSTPGNGKGGEDDIDQQCFTVPFDLCPNQKLEVSLPAYLTNVQWFKNGGTTSVATGNVVLFSEVGVYTFTATNQTCPANGCCPVIIEAGTNCCPVDICVPFTVKKKRK